MHSESFHLRSVATHGNTLKITQYALLGTCLSDLMGALHRRSMYKEMRKCWTAIYKVYATTYKSNQQPGGKSIGKIGMCFVHAGRWHLNNNPLIISILWWNESSYPKAVLSLFLCSGQLFFQVKGFSHMLESANICLEWLGSRHDWMIREKHAEIKLLKDDMHW